MFVNRSIAILGLPMCMLASFQWMKYCCWGIWTFLAISDASHLMSNWRYLDKFCLFWVPVRKISSCWLFQIMQHGFGLSCCICKKREIVSIVYRSNSFYWISFASCLFSFAFWLGRVLWHINHCRLFNAKSIFIHINRSISTNLVYYKYGFCLFIVKCQNSSISGNSV